MNSNGAGPAADNDSITGRLACQPCQRKKIKCDRLGPSCGQCRKSNLQCIPSTRKQRARHVGKRAIDGELRSRITKLESLVESLSSGEVAVPNTASGVNGTTLEDSPTSADSPTAASPSAVGKYVASPFWTSLATEVQGLRDALEDDHDGETPESNPVEQPPLTADGMSSLEYDLIVCPPGRIFVMPGAMADPAPAISQKLLTAFLENVEPLHKLYHKPTLVAFMQGGSTYLDRPADSPSNMAIKRAVWFSAVNTLSAHDCVTITGQSRDEALNHYKRLIGISLAQGDLVNTTDLALVQAFLTYLMSCRQTDSSRRVWTLVSILVRIATAMNIHREEPGRFSPHITELRRRLWHRICYLDIFSSIDRGTKPLIRSDEHTTPYPHSNNDEWDEHTTTTIPHYTDRMTDMSLSLMTYEACAVSEQLNRPETQPGPNTWEKRHQIALDLKQNLRDRCTKYANPAIPYHRFLIAVADSMSASMILRAVRPMQRHVSSVPPRVDSPYVLRMAVDNLRAAETVYEDPEFERWHWMKWVQWHALAVALAGLCSIRGTPLADEAWHYVERQFVRSAVLIADNQEGMLWRPIEKLYRKASNFRDAGGSNGDSQAMHSDPIRHQAALPDTTTTAATNAAPAPLDTFTNSNSGSALYTQRVPYDALPGLADTNADDELGGTMEPWPVDPSWLDWEQIMDDFADPSLVAEPLPQQVFWNGSY